MYLFISMAALWNVSAVRNLKALLLFVLAANLIAFEMLENF